MIQRSNILAFTAFKDTWKIILVPVLAIVFAYASLCIVAFFRADALLFPAPPSSYSDSGELIKIEVPGIGKITALYLPHPHARATILYSHGNGEDLGYIGALLREMNRQGFSVFAYDYPGYGTSEGQASERAVNAAADASYNFLTGHLKVPARNIILVGRSVGGGPSIELARKYAVGGLVVESGFTGAFRVVTRSPILPWEIFPNLSNIGKVKCPVLIVHGLEDTIVPFSHGEALLNAANPPKSFLWVEGAGHNDLIPVARDIYWDTLKSFARVVESNAPRKQPL